jgi:polyvinyl alcohol dehydrogenase (cytochrome)
VGSAVDGHQIYTANANSNQQRWPLPNGITVTDGAWSALDAVTGKIVWQASPRIGGSTSGPVTTTDSVVFGCALDPQGNIVALDAGNGAVLRQFASGGSCLSSAAISSGTVFWGSGCANLGFGTPNNKLYAFEVK